MVSRERPQRFKQASAVSAPPVSTWTTGSARGADTFNAFLDRSYYTTESAAVVVCQVGEPAAKAAGSHCLGTDPYWIPGASGYRGNVNYVSKITYLTKKRADQRRQVTWSVPMAEYWSGIRKRAIMPKEQFAQTYLAVIHGAKAISFFRWPFKVEQTRTTHTAPVFMGCFELGALPTTMFLSPLST